VASTQKKPTGGLLAQHHIHRTKLFLLKKFNYFLLNEHTTLAKKK